MKKAIQVTSAKNEAIIIIDCEDVKGIQDVSNEHGNGLAKVLTKSIGNFYVNETAESIKKAVFLEVMVVQ